MPASPIWVSAIEFDTSLDPPASMVRTSAPVATAQVQLAKPAPLQLGPPSLTDLVGTASRLVAAFEVVQRERPHWWNFSPRINAAERHGQTVTECTRWGDLGSSLAWRDLGRYGRCPQVGEFGCPDFVPGLYGLMLAISDARRMARCCEPSSIEQSQFCCHIGRICELRWTAGAIESPSRYAVRVPVVYPVERLELLALWARERVREHNLGMTARRILAELAIGGPLGFSLIVEKLSSHNATVNKQLRQLRSWGYISGGGSENYKITDLGRAALG